MKTSEELRAIIGELDNTKAMRVTALFLAQPEFEGKKPHEHLGFATNEAALNDVEQTIHCKKQYLRNVTSYFDKHTDNHRKGWGDELEGENKKIFTEFGDWPEQDLLLLIQEILSTEWADNGKHENQIEEADNLTFLQEDFPDLEQAQALVRKRLIRADAVNSLSTTAEFLNEVKKAYEIQVPNDSVEIVGLNTFSIQTAENNYVYVSTLELARCWATLPYVHALKKYIAGLDRFLKEEFDISRHSGSRLDLFKSLPDPSYATLFETHGILDIESKIDARLGDNVHADRFKRFLNDKQWSGIGKKLNRSDLLVSSIVKAGRWLAVAADRRGEFSLALSTVHDADTKLDAAISSVKSASQTSKLPILEGGENVIFYGAPGTGKSNRVEKIVGNEGKEPIRTVFHPDLQNREF